MFGLRRFVPSTAAAATNAFAAAAAAGASAPAAWHAPNPAWGQRRHNASAPQKDLYNLLGVQRGSTQEQIKKAYLGKAKKLHPDVNPSPKAADEFAEIKQAHDVLSDPQKRSVYDMTGNANSSSNYGQGFNPFASAQNGGGFGGADGGANPFAGAGGDSKFSFSDFEEIFEKMSGNKNEKSKKPQGPEPGADIHFKMSLTFLEAVNGISKEIAYNTFRKCGTCNGCGAKDGAEKAKCPHCNGRGKKVMSTGFFHMAQDCTNCGGTGETGRSTCTNCTGKGVVKDRAVQTLPVPKGVDNRERLKITGKGEAGVRNGPPGNLFVEISVEEHPVFHRDGADIHIVAPIALSTAVLGGAVRIPTLTGEVETKVPAGSQQGDKLVLRGRGVHRPNQNKTGDFYIHFAVQLPKELTAAQKEAIAQFAKDEVPTKLTDPQLKELKAKYKSWFTS